MNPIFNKISGAPAVVVTLKQPDVVAPEGQWRVSIERNDTATGTVTIKAMYFGCTQRTKITSIDLASLTVSGVSEPYHFNFNGDISDVEFSHVSLVGSYNAIVAGK